MDPNLLRHLQRGHREHVPGRRTRKRRSEARHHRAEREEQPWT